MRGQHVLLRRYIRSDEGERIFISEGENGCTLLLSKLENAYLYSRTPGMTGN